MREVISSFDFVFRLPNSDFSNTVEKSLKVELVNISMSPLSTKGVWKGYVFEVKIPDYLYDFVRDKHPDYSDCPSDIPTSSPIVFKHFIRESRFDDVFSKLSAMSTDALFFKKLSLMNEFNKVIFVKCNYSMNHIRDNYNFADMNNSYSLGFNYFVAYEVAQPRAFFNSDDTAELVYYGLKRYGDQHFRINPSGLLPLIRVTDLSKYVKIRWTQEREDFLEDTAKKIGKVASMIDEYVKKIDETTFDEIIDKSIKNKFLEYHGDDK